MTMALFLLLSQFLSVVQFEKNEAEAYEIIIDENHDNTTTDFNTTDLWHHNWIYKKELRINNPSEKYQMRITIYKENGHEDIEKHIVDCENNCNKNFSDIRFVDSDGTTKLPYWIEETGTDNGDHYTHIWVKTSGSDMICLYYGNENASSESSGYDTFLFFDDFSSNSIDEYYQHSTSDTDCYVRPDAELTDRRVRWKALLYDINANFWTGSVYYGTCSENSLSLGDFVQFKMSYNADAGATESRPAVTLLAGNFSGSSSSQSATPVTEGNSYIYDLSVVGGERVSAKIYNMGYNEIWSETLNTNVPYSLAYNFIEHYRHTDLYGNLEYIEWLSSSNQLQARCVGRKPEWQSTAWIENRFDWWFVGKYADPEPAWSSFGSEEVNPENLNPPIVDFIYSPSDPTDLEIITFYDTSIDEDGSIISWVWSFGDGEYAYKRNVTHQYTDNGVYIVTLNVTDNNGNSNETSKQITVTNVSPETSFTYYPPNPTTLDIIFFSDTSIDNDGIIVNWTWDFGDGEVSYFKNVTYQYSSNGTYNIKLTVKDDDGAIDDVTTFITLGEIDGDENIPPTADFSWSSDELKVGFTDISTDLDGSLVYWQWYFGDGSYSDQQNPSHTFLSEGTYLVTLNVTDNDGAPGSKTKTIILTENTIVTVYVDDDYDNTTPGWDVDHFNTIQDGINNVSEGGTVFVYNGVYFENIVVNKSLNLIGEDKSATVIDGSGIGNVVDIVADDCFFQSMKIRNSGQYAGIKILSNRNTLTNNILDNNYYGIWVESTSENTISNNVISNNRGGIRIRDSTDAIITENQILSNTLEGITLESSYSATILNNILQDNGITISGQFSAWNTHTITNNIANDKPIYYYSNSEGIIVPEDASQVILANCNNFEIKNLKIENVEIGVQLGFSSDIRIQGNRFESNSQSAIQLYYSNGNTIIQNTINDGNGIDLWESNNNNIWDNTITNTNIALNMYQSGDNNIRFNEISNNIFGIWMHSYCSNNVLDKNTISSNPNGGIWFMIGCSFNIISNNTIEKNSAKSPQKANIYMNGGCTNNVFVGNTISSESKTGVYIEFDESQCCNNLFYHNNFVNNEIQAYDKNTDSWDYSYDVGGNYWSDYSGEDNDGDGLGDTPYRIPGRGNQDRYPFIRIFGWNKLPNKPSNPFPQDKATGVNINSVFSWQCSDPEGDELTYDIYLGNNSNNLKNIRSNCKARFYDPGPLDYDTIYYWKIIARDRDHYATAEGPVWSFITENRPPIADFTWSPRFPKRNQEISFTDTSVDIGGRIVEWQWDFGDGNMSSEQNPKHSYSKDGRYVVTLIVTDNGGAINKISKPIFVSKARPVAKFTYIPSNPNTRDTIEFIDLSTDFDGEIVSWYWSFGGKTSSRLQNPTHRFKSPGTYFVSLLITDNDGFRDAASTYILIESDVAYKEDFEKPIGREWVTYKSSPYGKNIRGSCYNHGGYIWRMETTKGNEWNLNELVLHLEVKDASYLDLKFYTIEFSDDNHYLPDNFVDHFNGDGIAVSNDGSNWVKLWQYPDIAFSWRKYGPLEISDKISVNGYVYIKFQQYDNNPVRYNDGIFWDDISLSTDGIIKLLEVDDNQPPTADFTFTPEKPRIGEVIQFTDASTDPDPDDNIVSYEWLFTDSYHRTNKQNPWYWFASNGYYTVILKVTDEREASDTISKIIKVGNIDPTADFKIIPTNPTTKSPVTFVDNSRDPDGSVVTWSWDFGDGNTSDIQNPVHHYKKPGTYAVVLKVWDDLGGTDIPKTLYINVLSNNPPKASFTCPEDGRPGQIITFDASRSYDSDGDITGYRWDFKKDGVYDTDWLSTPIFTHTYINNGYYIVRLQVRDDDGDTITADRSIMITDNNRPYALFYVLNLPCYVNVPVKFDASYCWDNDGYIVGYRWDFSNDGIYDTSWLTQNTISHIYTSAGEKYVKLQVKDNEGATQSHVLIITVFQNAKPKAIIYGPFHGRVGDPIVLYSCASYDPDGYGLAGYRWDFENDGTYDTPWYSRCDTEHRYSSIGTYTVKVEVIDRHGATDTDTATVYVIARKPPVADAGGPYEGYIHVPVYFDASNSYDLDGWCYKFHWDFNNDGKWDMPWSGNWHRTYKYVYREPGIYTARLEIIDNEGFTDKDTAKVTIYANDPPVADAGGPYDGFIGDSIKFDASNSYDPDGKITSYRWDFDGDGLFDTSLLPSPITSHSYSYPGKYNVKLLVIDEYGAQDHDTTLVVIASSHLRGSWHLDEESGSIAYDSSGNDFHGEVYGGLWCKGKYGNALKFNGEGDYIEINGIYSIFDQFTISIWANVNEITGQQTLISRRDGTGIGRDILLLKDGEIQTNLGGLSSLETNFFPNAGDWHHYVVTYSENVLNIYIDGNLIITENLTEEKASGAFIIGANKQLNNYFNGIVDEITIWDNALLLYDIRYWSVI